MSTVRAYPYDEMVHEMETLSEYLRSFQDCPSEVRIRQEEGIFERPMVLLSYTSLGLTNDGPYHFYLNRTANVMWYGSSPDPPPGEGGGGGELAVDVHLEKDRAAGWLMRALGPQEDRMQGLVKIYDYQNPDDPIVTDAWVTIDIDSVDVTPRRDEFGLWTISADFRYSVEGGPLYLIEYPPPGDPVPGGPYIRYVHYRRT